MGDLILVDTASMEFRHQCEVRQVIRWRIEDRAKALTYLEGVKKKRPEEGTVLERDVVRQWKLGNRGQTGDWK